MKRSSNYYITFLLIIISYCSNAQRAEVMVLGGLSGSILKENGTQNSFARLYSPQGGLLAGIGGEYVFFETGILFSTRGSKLTINSSVKKLSMNYFDVPFLIVVAPEKFRFFIGPQFSHLTSAKLQGTGKVTDSYEKTSWGLRYGAGYNSRRFTLQLHLTNGFTDVNKSPNAKWKDQSFQLSLGYLLFRMYQPSESKKKEKDDDIIPSHRKID